MLKFTERPKTRHTIKPGTPGHGTTERRTPAERRNNGTPPEHGTPAERRNNAGTTEHHQNDGTTPEQQNTTGTTEHRRNNRNIVEKRSTTTSSPAHLWGRWCRALR